jgi:hypothetical protein
MKLRKMADCSKQQDKGTETAATNCLRYIRTLCNYRTDKQVGEERTYKI